MSKFNISYNIIAIDRFSGVAKAVEQKALQMQKVMRNTINSNIDRQTLLGKTYARTSDVIKGYSKMPTFNFKAPLTSFSNFLGKMKILSYRSWQMMYTALPLIAIFKRPFEDLVSLQKNSIILTNEIGTRGANAVDKINTAISKTTLMSKASLTDASRILAQNGASVNQIRRLMPVVSDMAASSGGNTTVSQMASQLNTMLRSKDSQPIDGIIIQGSTVADRLQSLLSQYSTIQDTAEKQANTPTGKLVKSFMLLSDSLRGLLKAATPAFNILSRIINSIANDISNLAKNHKHLSNVIIGFVGVVLTAIAVLLTFKVIGMGVIMITRGLTYGILVAEKAFTVIIATIRIARTVMLLLNAAFLANPIGVLIGAMILLGSVLYVAYQKLAIVRKVVNAIGSAFMSVAKNGLRIFATAMSWLIKKVTEGFALILHAVGYFSSDAEKWANSLDKVTNSWDKVSNAQKKVIANHKNMNSTSKKKVIANHKNMNSLSRMKVIDNHKNINSLSRMKVIDNHKNMNSSSRMKVIDKYKNMNSASKMKVIDKYKNMNSTLGMEAMLDYQKIINQTIGIKDNSSQSNVNNVNVHLYQNGNKTRTYNSKQRETSIYNIDNSDVYALGSSMMGDS